MVRHRSMSSSPSACSWHLVTYMLGWLLASAGIGLMVLSSDPVSTKGSWLPVLVAGIGCTALGGCFIVIAVSIPENISESSWCGRSKRRLPRSSISEKHEGVYIRFPSSDFRDSKVPLKLPLPELIQSSPIKAEPEYDVGTLNSKNGTNLLDSSWCSSRGLTLLSDESLQYSESDERTAIMFYRETPV